jgi:hypothetical protein
MKGRRTKTSTDLDHCQRTEIGREIGLMISIENVVIVLHLSLKMRRMKRDEVIGIEDGITIVPRPLLKMQKKKKSGESVDVGESMRMMSMMLIEVMSCPTERESRAVMILRGLDHNRRLSLDVLAIGADAIVTVIAIEREIGIEREKEIISPHHINTGPHTGHIETGVEAASVTETKAGNGIETVTATAAIVTDMILSSQRRRTKSQSLDHQLQSGQKNPKSKSQAVRVRCRFQPPNQVQTAQTESHEIILTHRRTKGQRP